MYRLYIGIYIYIYIGKLCIVFDSIIFITMTSHERRGVSNRRQIRCLLNRLFRPSSERTSKPALLVPCEGNLFMRWLVDSLHTWPVPQKPFHLMMSSCDKLHYIPIHTFICEMYLRQCLLGRYIKVLKRKCVLDEMLLDALRVILTT